MKSRPQRLTEALDELRLLLDEIKSWRENIEGTNLEMTQKYQDLEDTEEKLEEAISILEDVVFPGMY